MISLDSLYNSNTDSFLRENQDGNIEYKWRLDTKTNLGINKLVSQLLWRISEGKEITGLYEAYYIIGILDDGRLGKLTKEELDKSIDIFNIVLAKANLDLIKEEYKLYKDSNVYLAHVKKKSVDKFIEEKNIIFIGESQSGKTSVIANLCYDMFDNGKGFSRNMIFKHEHEKKNGLTSSIKKEIIGINKKLNNNSIINYTTFGGWDEITSNSECVINLYDFPGDEQYQKTILCGLMTHNPDHVFIFYNNDVNKIKFYVDYCKQFNYPYTILSNKSVTYDMIKYSNLLDGGIDAIKEIILNLDYSSKPRCFISHLFRINDVYNIADKGTIISGLQLNGIISHDANKKYKCINYSCGEIRNIMIKSIHKKNIDSKNIDKLESGTISVLIKDINNNDVKITKHLFITDEDLIINKTAKLKIKFNTPYHEILDTIIDKIKTESIWDYKKNTYKNTPAIFNPHIWNKWQKNYDRLEIIIYNGNFIMPLLSKVEKVNEEYIFELDHYITLQDENIMIQIKNFNKCNYDIDNIIFGKIIE